MKRLVFGTVLAGLLTVILGCDGPKSSAPTSFSPLPQGVQSVGGGGNKPGADVDKQ